MKKICVVMSSMVGAGAEKMVMYISNALQEQRELDVDLILFQKIGENLKNLNSELQITDLKSKLGIIGLLKLIIALKKKKPDIIFISLGPLNAIFSIFLFLFKRTKIVARETNIPSILNNLKKKEKKVYYIIDKLYKKTYKNYDIIIAQSDDMKKDLIQNYNINPKKIIMINNLVDEEKVNILCNLKDEDVDNMFEEGKIYGIAVGRLTEQKGYDLLLERVVQLKDSDIVIYILGDGELKKDLENKIIELGIEKNIKLLSFKDNPYLYLKRANFYVLSSRVEGFPNSLLEALSCGLPAIVNNCKGGIREIIMPGINGEIIDFNDKNINFEKLIKKVIKYDNNQIKEDIFNRYNKKKILKKYIEVLK